MRGRPSVSEDDRLFVVPRSARDAIRESGPIELVGART
jgi:hypothetical protein